MRENLHRFFRAARGAGVRLSPAESIDAMRAVSKVGFADRSILRDTFLLTLAKTQDEKKALGDCFDLFFDQPEPDQITTALAISDRHGWDPARLRARAEEFGEARFIDRIRTIALGEVATGGSEQGQVV